MKILLATSKITPAGGGIASYNQELLKAFNQCNTSFDCITEEDISEAAGVNQIITIKKRYSFSYEECAELLDWIKSNEYDLIVNSDSPVISLLSSYIKVPIISISHLVNGKFACIAGYNYNYLNNIVSLSCAGKKYIEKKFNIKDNNKVKVIYNFVNSDGCILKEEKKNNKCKIIVFPGGTSPHKCFYTVISAIKKLCKTNLEFQFYWIGNNKLPLSKFCLAGKLEDLLPLDNRIITTGIIPRDLAISIIQSANIFVLPSKTEGCPMTLLEAMQTGCIPIVSDAPHASEEILRMGNFGKIVKSEDADSLYNAILDVLTNPIKYKEDYSKSFDFTNSKLSQSYWMSEMTSIIYNAQNNANSKEYVDFEKKHFEKNKNHFLKIMKVEIFRERLDRIRACIICNRLYINKLLGRM